MTTELELFRAVYRYHFKKLRSYLRTIWSLPVKERYRDRRSTFPSLVDLYLHILDDYRFWFITAYTGRSFEEFPLGTRLSRAEAERATRDVDRLVSSFLRRLVPEDLDRKFFIQVDRRSITIRSMLLQMIEGDLEHKGELNALLWQMDVQPPAIDLARTRAIA
ncbi:MAG TPA: DinB family protein [Thermoplasmata archaeon]|nr:DinB family protein [Thermoplasmata archaeon]